jgi:hypothetical protein
LFETALRQIVRETETLSVRFVEQAEDVNHFVGTAPDWAMGFIDVTHERDPLAAAEAWMNADMARPVNPVSDPLFTYPLLKAVPDRFFWYARYHHLIMDSVGEAMVAQRLAGVYTALARDQRPDDSHFGSVAVLDQDVTAYRASEQFILDGNYWLERKALYLDEHGELIDYSRFRQSLRSALMSFQRRPIDVLGVLIRAKILHEEMLPSFDVVLGWSELFPRGLEVLRMPGDHWWVPGNESFPVLAERITACIDRHVKTSRRAPIDGHCASEFVS